MLAATQPEVYVDGRRLSNLAPGWGELKVSSRWSKGPWEISWKVPVRRQRRVRELQAGAKVRVYYGAALVSRGDLLEPDWNTGEMVASGSARQGEQALALGADGAITTIPDVAIDQAIARGAVDWTRRTGSFSNSPFTDPAKSSAPIYLNDLLDSWAAFNDLRWAVNARGEVYASADPTVPSLVVSPDSGVLGVVDDLNVQSVVVRYLNTASTYANVRRGTGAPEVGVSLEKFGVITQADATAKADALLAQFGTIRGWANGLTLAASQVSTAGGSPVNLAQVRAGQMMRLQGLRDERGRSAVTDIVLGETIWDVGDRTVTCNPVNLVARDLSSIIEDAGATLLTGI